MLEILNAYSPAITATATVIVAAATVVYATFTYLLLKEQRREKKKSVREEMLNLIIKPLLFGVQSEIQYLREKRFGWYHIAKTMLFVKTLELKKSGAEEIVYQNFAKAHPNIHTLLKQHNVEISHLERELENFADKLISAGLKEKCMELIVKYNQKDDSNIKLSDSNAEYFIGDVIDGRKEFEKGHQFSEFWEVCSPELLKFREGNGVREHIKKVEDMRREHLHTCEELEAELIQLMNKFRDDYGIEIAKGDTQFHGI